MPEGPFSSPISAAVGPPAGNEVTRVSEDTDPVELLVAHVDTILTIDGDAAGPKELAVAVSLRSEHAKVLLLHVEHCDPNVHGFGTL